MIQQVLDQLLGIEAKIDNLDTSGPDISGLEATTADIHDHVDGVEPQLDDIQTGISSVNGTLGELISEISDISSGLVQVSDDIEQSRQLAEAQWASLIDDQTAILSGEHGAISLQIDALSTEHQALKNEILAAVAASGGSGTQITKTESSEMIAFDDQSERVNTLYIGSTPKRVTLWIYGYVKNGSTVQAWEQADPTQAAGRDAFAVAIYVNDALWTRQSLTSETREGYLSWVFNPIDDLPLSGQVTIKYHRTLSDGYRLDSDPFVIVWYVE